MPDKLTYENTEETKADPNSAAPVLTQQTRNRFRLSAVHILLAAMIALCAIALLVYALRPRPAKTIVAVETPPSLEGKSTSEEGAEHADEHSQEGAIEVSDEMAELIGIKTEQVANGEIEETIASTGKALVAPEGQAVVGAKADGRVARALAEPGQSVNRGQVLVVIDSPQVAELRGQLIEAQSKFRLAEQNRARIEKIENRAAVIQAKNKLDFAQSNLDRKRRLAELGAAAGREVAEAEVEFKNAKAEYEYQSSIQTARERQQAASEVEQARAVVERIIQSLAALGAGASGQGGAVSITSPISGTVTDRHFSIGQAVTQGSELMTVMNLSNVIIEAELPESKSALVRAGQALTARVPALPDRIFEGRVESVGNSVNAEKRTVPVRARIANAGALLKHEMAVEVRIVTGARKDGLLVPVSALVEDDGIKIVYAKEGERYERRPVAVGTINYKFVEIRSGVKAGEEVVTVGAYQLKNMHKGGGEEGGHHDDH